MPSSLQGKTVTVFGGTGFLGRYIVARLAKAGAAVRIVSRHPQSGYFLKTNGTVGQIVTELCLYRNADDIARHIKGSDMVINCVATLREKRRAGFKKLHVDLAQWIAQGCASQEIERLVHISALGVDKSRSRYAKSKLAGEKIMQETFPKATILRPSVMFGPEDQFFNMFASLARFSPVLPLIGGGKTRFQPVYVADVADAALAALTLSDVGPSSPLGKIYELGGPEILSLREVYERLSVHTGVRRCLLPLPWLAARLQALLMSLLPNAPLTNDQITSLQTDNVVSPAALTLNGLGLRQTALDSILPSYLDRFRPGGRFAEKKRA